MKALEAWFAHPPRGISSLGQPSVSEMSCTMGLEQSSPDLWQRPPLGLPTLLPIVQEVGAKACTPPPGPQGFSLSLEAAVCGPKMGNIAHSNASDIHIVPSPALVPHSNIGFSNSAAGNMVLESQQRGSPTGGLARSCVAPVLGPKFVGSQAGSLSPLPHAPKNLHEAQTLAAPQQTFVGSRLPHLLEEPAPGGHDAAAPPHLRQGLGRQLPEQKARTPARARRNPH